MSESTLPDNKNGSNSRYLLDMGQASSESNKVNYVKEEKTAEPLCWEEQLKSKKVKILQQSQPPTLSHPQNKAESHPVVFHDKRGVKDVLQRTSVQFHLSSRCLPKFQEKEQFLKDRTSKKRTTKCLSTEQLTKCPSIDDKLQLKGQGMPFYSPDLLHQTYASRNGVSCSASWERFPEISHTVERTGDNQDQVNLQSDGSHDFPVTLKRIDAANQPSTVLDSTAGAALSREHYRATPVCVPNANSPETEQTDETCLSTSETENLEFSTKSIDAYMKDLKNGSRVKEMHQNLTSVDTGRSPSTGNSVDNGIDKCWYGRQDSSVKKKTLFSSHSFPNLMAVKHSNPLETSSSGFSVSTPSSSPLFQERNISPSRALNELRKTFCENIRNETRQLEFDLQELYLKKKLHKR